MTQLDLAEKGRARDGTTDSLDRRLFFQLAVFTNCESPVAASAMLGARSVNHVLYQSLHDPSGIGVLTYSEQPDYFIDTVAAVFNADPFLRMRRLHDFTMFGRTYSIGYETDLEEALISRPLRRVQDPSLQWAVWYPVRRRALFERLPAADQRAALKEHGTLGHRFGAAGHAHDIRLAAHGLDVNNNDFIVGLVGPDLHPLSALVQAMRGTVQTSEYVDQMGPFFVGRALRRES